MRKHPRRCGELRTHRVVGIESSETPPQMRGTRAYTKRPTSFTGNTPADAGNSAFWLTDGIPSRKHPRRCGELLTVASVSAADAETPPQMRGTLERTVNHHQGVGNTPADAGNSKGSARWSTFRRKHPRRCGELLRNFLRVEFVSETPPQMRGTRFLEKHARKFVGNTPADAGNSGMGHIRKGPYRKHPRRCGELDEIADNARRAKETPPQMRGTLAKHQRKRL